MKITIEYEDDKRKSRKDVFDNVASCAFIGFGFHKEISHYDIHTTYCPETKDSYYDLIGKCYEMIQRLKYNVAKISS